MLKKLTLAAVLSTLLPSVAIAAPANYYANHFDKPLAGVFEAREKDWRNGAVVYQVLVDRFAPSANLAAKKALYPAPKRLKDWSEPPTRGTYLPDVKVWSHEIDFWGGDLQSLSSKLGYIKDLGADVLYLNPVHLAYTNHKYDALDYNAVSPEFGTRNDVKKLTADVHKIGMKMVLDGVFNHMGRNSQIFKSAASDPKSPYRDWFYFGSQYAGGARSWALAENLPELNLENPKVAEYIYGGPKSVVRSYLRDGIDGWRLDVAFDIGFKHLDALTKAAHAEKPGSLVVGEIANYPKEWFPSVDAVMHFGLRHIMIKTAQGTIDAPTAGRMISRMIDDAGIEPMLKSWTYLDNHDTFRLATVLPNQAQQRVAQVLQFTLPGAANLYYGSELGMTGGDDPEMRGPMRWDLVNDANQTLAWTKSLISLRKQQRALRVGNYRTIVSNKLLAFERYTDRVEDTIITLINPSAVELTETVMVPNSKLMNDCKLLPLLASPVPAKALIAVPITAALLTVTIPAHGFLVLKPEIMPAGGYSSYKRVQ